MGVIVNMKKYIVLILCAVFFCGSLVAYFVTTGDYNDQLHAQELEISELQSRVGNLSAAIANKQTQLIHDITGLNVQRLNEDKEVISDFLELVCTWDTYVEYMDAREKIMRRYGLAEDSQFMSIFMPVVGNKTSPDGTNYNQIDTNGLNMKYESITPYVTRIRAGEYSYFSVVRIISSWKNGGETVVRAVITYTVNADGELSDISAVPLAD